MLESFGTTSDMMVAALLAIGQLITPIPDAGVQRGEKIVSERNACKTFQDSKAAYQAKNCEALKSDRRAYKEECQSLEGDVGRAEVQCSTDKEVSQILRYRPRPLEQYATMSNQELTQELHKICYAIQDRVFLEAEQWQNGEVADRDDLSDKMIILQDKEGNMQKVLSSILVEAGDGSFQIKQAYNVAMFLCHWKVDRKLVGERVDFRGGVSFLRELMAELPRVDRLPELPQASFVYDNKDERIGEIYDRDFVVRNGKYYINRLSRRRTVTAEQIPKMLMNAFVAIEDKRFPTHNGFDFEALKRLIYAGASAKQGGSTFTMQLIKNVFFGADVETERAAGKRTLRRKIKEILMIPMVEQTYTKSDILTYYLNLISLTSNSQGVLMTAMDLFKKDDLHQLTIGEAALMAAMPKGVSAYNPWRRPEAAKARRNLVLEAMADQGYISASDRDYWKEQPLNVVSQDAGNEARVYSRFFTGHITNHFGGIKKKNLRDTRWAHGGFDIKTSFNLGLQKAVTQALQSGLLAYEKSNGRYRWKPWLDPTTDKQMNVAKQATKPGAEMDDVFELLQVAHPYPETNWVVALKTPKSNQWLLDGGKRVPVAGGDGGIFSSLKPWDAAVLEPGEKGVYRLASGTDVQGAVVILDAESGEVLAMSGGFTAGSYGRFAQNNRVTRSMRQPGSTIKPITTYLHALNRGVPPNFMLRNGGVRFPKIDQCPYHWSPNNYGGGGGGGVILRKALENSMNLPVINLFVHTAGMSSVSDFGGDLPEQVSKMQSALYEVYDLAVALGAYPSRESLMKRNAQLPCFPFLLGGYETTPLNMAQAYAALANGGLRRDPIFLRQVFKGNQPLIVDHTQELREQVQQYREAVKRGVNIAPETFGAVPGVSAASVAQLRSIMQGVLKRGTATRIKQWGDLIAGKTGTTNDSKDVWFDAYTNKISVVTWVGYDDDKIYDNLGGATGGGVAVPIFERIMNAYFKMNPGALNDPLITPEDLPGMVHAKVDMASGKVLSVGSCNSGAGGSGVDEYLIQSSVFKDKRTAPACAVSKNRNENEKTRRAL